MAYRSLTRSHLSALTLSAALGMMTCASALADNTAFQTDDGPAAAHTSPVVTGIQVAQAGPSLGLGWVDNYPSGGHYTPRYRDHHHRDIGYGAHGRYHRDDLTLDGRIIDPDDAYDTRSYIEAPAYPHSERVLDLELTFRSGGTRFSVTDQALLDDIGDALRNRTSRHKRFVIAGHTDASGDAFDNQLLSQRRAERVKSHLIAHYGAQPHQLIAVGYGESVLLDEENPTSSANRRVEIIAVSAHEARELARYERSVHLLSRRGAPDLF